ncbi:MAG: flagellar hook assembly protein FlgD [Sterolibacteriaceae bacterium]|nr:flagellar hook assembly protein FlgD [Sterolibacteriaceae bacterium]MBK9085496.1 flagellar hook assembly protein FlgD [Sterolibacteriaceae bacterium]
MASVNASSNTLSPEVLSAINGAGGTTRASAAVDGQDRFLMLLTTQLKNQDPLNPMDNAQMTSQLAQISTVDGINKLNSTLEKLVGSQQGSEALQAAALVGRDVLVEGRNLQIAGAGASAGIELASAADNVAVNIVDANGLAVRTLSLGALDAGAHRFDWDGKSGSGAQVADGAYTMTVQALKGNAAVVASPLQISRVTSVVRETSGVSLDLGAQGRIGLADVKEIL